MLPRRRPPPPFSASSLPLLFSPRLFCRPPEMEAETGPELRRESPTLSFPALLQPYADADAAAEIVLRHHNLFHAMEYSHLQLSGTLAPSPHLVLQTLLRPRHASKVARVSDLYKEQITFTERYK
ncbi:hypothetical protein Taro_013099 [Colocasia esculenta]|uniref:Uncharacterized protein n=1 Tax=Colocasia esculenta TaxID=4460 RepID=A0A843UB43_COLES|nr:hypothetical protein [Colocasia esculenta]